MTMHHGSSFARSAHQSIKPIETLWKGYRFRSRLEARWAVFFETLGLNWEYEPQGFELPDGSRYLPDFYLPDQETYIEIKPQIDHQFEKVYLAGKFSTDNPDNKNWRSAIVHQYENGAVFCSRMDRWFNEITGPFPASSASGHDFVIPCTHSLFGYGHRDYSLSTGVLDPKAVFDLCMDAISRCTVFFAWIDSLDCYGTLAEIGYAKALGKKIYIGIDEKLEIPWASINDSTMEHGGDFVEQDDLWFVKRMANKTVVTDSALTAYLQLINPQISELKKIQQLNSWMLISGNPHPGEYKAFRDHYERGCLWFGIENSNGILNWLCFWDRENQPVLNALAVARAARFEHGEKP